MELKKAQGGFREDCGAAFSEQLREELSPSAASQVQGVPEMTAEEEKRKINESDSIRRPTRVPFCFFLKQSEI